VSSPVAHCALVFWFWPGLRRHLPPANPARIRWLLSGLVLLALLAPDLDVLWGLISSQPLRSYHNGITHSLLLGVPFGVLFGLIWCGLAGRGALPAGLLGMLAYQSHVIIDFFTWGRGVLLFWPLTGHRFQSPFFLFLGVRHSGGVSAWVHLVNFLNDVAFALVVWLVARWVQTRRQSAPVHISST
jgi:membrane-bound metal-dependent hydrolase YbcI (DUF457 family)